MFCSVYKWRVSQALDSGKSISGFLQKHLQRCDSCREYAEFCTSLKPEFAEYKKAILEDFNEGVNKKIMAAIPDKSEWRSGQDRKVSAHKFTLRRTAFIPSLAAALAVLAVSISIVFFALPRAKQTPPIGQISALISAASPEDVLSKVESPLEKEYTELKRTFESTSKYLISSLDFRIGQQAK
jgi:hypothetical protein